MENAAVPSTELEYVVILVGSLFGRECFEQDPVCSLQIASSPALLWDLRAIWRSGN